MLQLPDNVKALNDSAEDNMFIVKMWRGHGRDEELGAIGISSRIRHTQQKGLVVLSQKKKKQDNNC